MEGNQFVSLSPSFSSYSSAPNLSEIADRVVREFRHQSGSDFDHLFSAKEEASNPNPRQGAPAEEGRNDGGDEDFEFAFVCREPESFPMPAEKIFPLFNRDLLFAGGETDPSYPRSTTPTTIRLTLGRLLMEDRKPSSESEDLNGVPSGTYCVWNRAAAPPPRRCKKRKSTGNSSRRWKFLDLLLGPNPNPNTNSSEKTSLGDSIVAGNVKRDEGDEFPAAPEEADYGKRNGLKGGERRRSLLPHKRDAVGFLSTVNELSRNVHPF